MNIAVNRHNAVAVRERSTAADGVSECEGAAAMYGAKWI